MDQFVARANIDHFLDLLRNNDLPAERISSINKLLIEEEEKLGQSLEGCQLSPSDRGPVPLARRFS
jgi:hypothetical protein